VLLLGQLLIEIGMREGLEVCWLPSYGPEMRSGSAALPCVPVERTDRVATCVASRCARGHE
jgi:hypothetical protein